MNIVCVRWILALTIAILACPGCGGVKYKGDKRYPLTGAVTYMGEPVDIGSITLLPEGGQSARSGGVIKDGKFDIPEPKGPNAGKYRVELSWLKMTGKRLMDETTGEMYDERKEALPAKYHKQSTLSIEIPAEDDNFDFVLE
jgi:hypothetical protein